MKKPMCPKVCIDFIIFTPLTIKVEESKKKKNNFATNFLFIFAYNCFNACLISSSTETSPVAWERILFTTFSAIFWG